MVSVPHNMTNYFQTIDLTVNQSCKSLLDDKAKIQYTKQVQAQISNGTAPKSVSLHLKISILKPIHVKWVTQYYDHIRTVEDVVTNGWHRSGITKGIKKNTRKEDPFENQIVLDLYLYGRDFKKTSFDSSLIFVKDYQLIFVEVSLPFANDIFQTPILCRRSTSLN